VPDGGPRDPALPRQLTYNLGQDLEPAWMIDGSALAYSFQPAPDTNNRCLALLPPAGGTIRGIKCVRTDTHHDSVTALTEVTPGPGGLAAWVDARGLRGRTAPDQATIRVGTLTGSDSGAPVRSLPYLAPSGLLHVTATHIGWLNPNTLTYVGADVFYTRACSGCKLDTLVIGREVARLDLTASPPNVSVVPNTDLATSVWPAADGTSIYYTVAGDSRVFNQVLSSGSVTMVHDFGGLGIARDVCVRGSILVAVVGGNVAFSNDPVFGPRQDDAGGFLYRVDLGTGAETAIGFPGHLARRAAVLPAGSQVAVEGLDSAGASPIADLWLLGLP
jgi:hypothetical protein